MPHENSHALSQAADLSSPPPPSFLSQGAAEGALPLGWDPAISRGTPPSRVGPPSPVSPFPAS